MRFLVPVAVLLATMLLISRQPKGAIADEEVIVHPIFTIEMVEAAAPANTEPGIAYDEVVESSGLLNRLELLDF